MTFPKHMQNKGFTLIELLIVIVISGIIIGILISSFSTANTRMALDTSTAQVAAVLNEAHSSTLSSLNASQYGVELQVSQIILFKGSSYSAGAASNIVTTLNPLVGIRNVSLAGGGTSVVFKRLNGSTDQYGTLEVYLLGDSTTFRTVIINATGLVE